MTAVIEARAPVARAGPGQRALALALGVACHGTFLLAVTAMALGLHGGLARGVLTGRGGLSGGSALLADVVLALQFPLLHSFLLTQRGRAFLVRLMGRHGRDLATTTYAGCAALQILGTFALWSPTGITWCAPHGAALVLNELAFAGAWAFLGKALLDGGLGLQTGWIGWSAVWRGERPRFPDLPRAGLFAACRQPIYLGFLLTLWTGPVWTPDHLLLATLWSSYCVLGPLHKERRYLRMHGERFAEYRRAVPYMLPVRWNHTR